MLATEDTVRAVAPRIAGAARIFLAGTGTSYHGALVGEHLFRSAGHDARAIPAFEFGHYAPGLTADDALVLVSHRGTKRFSNGALDQFSKLSKRWVVIAGEGAPFDHDGVVRTVPQEPSAVHSASHVAAMLRLAQLASAVSRDAPDWSRRLSELPGLVQSATGLRQQIAALASRLDIARPIHFVGAGPAWATALEGALKLTEASYVSTVGHELENFLHGPLITIARGQAVIVIASAGPAIPRVQEITNALAQIGAVVVTVGSAASAVEGATHFIETPAIPETLAPILNVIPLQWLAYELAQRVGVDPDPFRRNEPAYAAALQAAPL